MKGYKVAKIAKKAKKAEQSTQSHTPEQALAHVQETKQALELKQTFSYIDIGEGLAAYKLTWSAQVVGDLQAASMKPLVESFTNESTQQGIARLTELQSFEAGKRSSLPSMKVEVLSDKELQIAAKEGFTAMWEVRDKLESQPFELAQAGKLNVSNVVKVDYGSHLIHKLDGTLLPVAIHFDYIQARMHSGVYDLDKAYAVLKANPQVHELKGEDIPYYNAVAGKTKSLRFRFEPTCEQMNQIYAASSALNPRYPSTSFHAAVFDLDMLGLRKAGATECATFYDSKPGCEDF